MESSNFLIFFSCIFLISGFMIVGAAQDSAHHRREETGNNGFRPRKMFVFGDSYADTGNVRKALGNSWKEPYGTTFPGKPAGRFSDGRVLTDYIANFLGLKSPIAYIWTKFGGKLAKLQYGTNFAYGGSGVFDTLGNVLPNMTTQIDFLEKLTNNSVCTALDLHSSVVLVSLAGNDYAAFLANGGTNQGLQTFIPIVINQLSLNLKRLQKMGAAKVIVTALEPLGCLPRITLSSSFQQCNATQNVAVNYHNLLLQQSVAKLNNDTNSSTFFILDLYNSFTTVIEQKGDSQGNLKFETPLKPCCMGVSEKYSCGSVDEKGVKMYTVCSDPKTAFFWDSSHPTEAGWHAVYTILKSSLGQLFQF
ncbi:hypothetical protein ABFS82_10G050900 [Erythranthe guttata]|uniref:SGNH hydrolase-type esterase domain-containing protein n=1 Tax=Erythranthe guttata TaxID=4155 RepID=A0A022R9A9_ERYGU|nr:PREDICTED: GDSL esterase/lipase At5g03610-like [Erythranthe guttata]EYU35460.1 hypothetical protein MIMGU_mgv1a008828mg [Erythranthe guttata]|eukprot:XP_012839697.1 PREDICTED: GDSL esterase/lipase At5g03610-like [Erythranthe guttata]